MKFLASWKALPHKDQLAVLVFARFCEPLLRTSISAYIYYQLESFKTVISPAETVKQAAILQAVFTFFQCATVLFWGKLADSPRGGRKVVLLLGLTGSMLSCIAFGFVTNFTQAVIVRAIEGSVNGNTAVIRTMVSEVVQEPRYQQQAFLLMPIAFNIAVLIGPLLAGLVLDADYRHPQESEFDTKILSRYPFAKPALLNGAITFIALALVFLRLKETLESLRDKHDYGLELASKLVKPWRTPEDPYGEVVYDNLSEETIPKQPRDTINDNVDPVILPLRRLFTPNLCLTIICQGLLEGHLTAYNTLWASFLSAPVAVHQVGRFSGGLGMKVGSIAISLATIGLVGLPFQIFVYPLASKRIGTLKLWRVFLFGFPLAYFITPFLLVVPTRSLPPAAKDGPAVWALVGLVQTAMVFSSTFVVPAQLFLTNSASPHPTALGRTHSLAVLVSALARSLSPLLGGSVLGYGLDWGMSELAWWLMSLVAISALCLSFCVREGNGHEIRLPGDDEIYNDAK